MLKAVFEAFPSCWAMRYSASSAGSPTSREHRKCDPEVFQNAINKAGQDPGTRVEDLRLGDKLANLDMGAEESKNEAAFYKQQADRSFENLGPLLRDALTDAIDTAQTVVLNSADMVSSLYGDIGLDFKTALDEIVAPDLEAIAQKADAANQTKLLSQIASSGEGTAASTAETADNTKQTDTRMGSQIASMLSDGLTSVFTGPAWGRTGGLMGMVATEMLGGVTAIITLQPIIDIIFNTLSPLGILLTILRGSSRMEPRHGGVQPLVDTFTWIGTTLAVCSCRS